MVAHPLQAVETHKSYICKETLTEKLDVSADDSALAAAKLRENFDLEGNTFQIGLSKIG